MKKKLFWMISCFTLCLSVLGCQSAQKEEAVSENQENVIYGDIVEINTEDEITMATIENENGQTILTFGDNTIIYHAKDRYPLIARDLEKGMKIKAYIDDAMTLSEPPRVNAKMILAEIEEKSPDYILVKEAVLKDSILTITANNGDVFEINTETCQIDPYRTKNIVTFMDVHAGKYCLIWPQKDYMVLFS